MNYNEKLQKVSKKYTCVLCHYTSSNKHNYEKHMSTPKHKNTTEYNKEMQINALKHKYECECGKNYPYKASLFNHKKKCMFNKYQIIEEDLTKSSKLSDTDDSLICNDEIIDYKAIIMKLIDENSEFKNLIIKQQNQIGELIPKVGNNNNNTNIKQKFNINIFLNEQCKDALNMDDFLKQITVTLENLDITKSRGLTEGLSNVFIENMNKLSVFERPMHCTDAKRETLYIKENDTWEKDNDKSKIRDAIKSVSATQYKNMKQWMDANPDYMDDPDKQDYFIHMVKNCGKSINDIDDKIIKRLCLSSYIKDIMNEQINE